MASGGFALASKLKAGRVRSFEARLATSEPRTVISDYTGPGRRGVFTPEGVRIESGSGETLSERSNPREAFRSFRHNLWWDDLDLLYFVGYALWGYMAAPFVFARPGFEVREAGTWDEDGERWSRLEVTFPPEVPNHSRQQTFYFDEAGLLRRLDYTAEVFGSWAKAAHYCWEHREIAGLVVPTRRKVLPRKRNGRPRPRPTLIWIEIEHVELVGG